MPEAGRKKGRAKNRTPVQTPKSERLAQIYQTAARIIHEQGYDATSLNDIAKACGLTKAGLYHYVSSKESLLYEIMNYGMDLVESDVLAPARLVEDPRDRLRTIVRTYANLIMMERQAITIMVNETNGLNGKRRGKIRERRHVFYSFVCETIQRIKDEHGVPVVDVGVTTLNFVGCLVWLAYWYHADGRLSKEQVTEELVVQLVDRMVGLSLPLVQTAKSQSANRP